MLMPRKPDGMYESDVFVGGRPVRKWLPRWDPTSQGVQLREARKKLGLTLRVAAAKVGMTMKELSSVESGQAIFTDATYFGEALKKLEG